MKESSALPTLLAQVRRRRLLSLSLDQAALGAAAAMVGAIGLLLAGTQILDWYWPVLLFAAAAGLGAWRSWRLWPSPYQVAQGIDRQMNLHDCLSTAWHFRDRNELSGPRLLLWDAQQREAERLAAGVSPADAFPQVAPRYLSAAALLGLAALGLFGLRYGLSGGLDLREPLLAHVPRFFGAEPAVIAKQDAPRLPARKPLEMDADAYTPPDPLDPYSKQGISPVDIPGSSGDSAYMDRQSLQPGDMPDEEGDAEDLDAGEENASGRDSKSGDRNSSESASQSQDGKAQSPASKTPRDDSGLLNKMRDAMANLLAKLKIQPPAMTTSETGSSSEGQAETGRKEVASTPSGKQKSGDPQGQGMPTDDPDSGAEGEGDQQAQGAQTQAGQKSGDQASQSSKSGIGKQDGDKDIRDAAQEAAMGKLSELFGRRAENVTGEVMMEVTSSKQQQLRTAYSGKSAAHRESGGEIHRDEVPLLFQHYVQQYFEQVRKNAPPSEASPSTGASR